MCSCRSSGTASLPIAAFTPISANETTLKASSAAAVIASRARTPSERVPASCQSTTSQASAPTSEQAAQQAAHAHEQAFEQAEDACQQTGYREYEASEQTHAATAPRF
jgi:hypothetical protein